MNYTLLATCFLVILPFLTVERIWCQAPVAPADSRRLGIPALIQPRKLPFRLYWEYLAIVEGSIGNFERLNFLVDTGAYPSVVDQEIARRLKLAPQPARVNLSNRSVQ